MATLPIFAPDAVERALLAQAGQSIPVAQSITATRPPKFTVPVPNLVIPSLKTGAGSPVGVVVPDYIDQAYFDTTGVVYYISTGLTNTSWTELGGIPPFSSNSSFSNTYNFTGYDFNNNTSVTSITSTIPRVGGFVASTGHTISQFHLSSITLCADESGSVGDIDIFSEGPPTSIDLSNLTGVAGSLTLICETQGTGGTAGFPLSNLISVGGSVTLEGTALIQSLSALTTIGGGLSLSSLFTTGISAPLLSSIGGAVTISPYFFGGLNTLSFPALTTTTGGGITVAAPASGAKLTSLSLPVYVPINGESLTLSGLALTVTAVNNLLIQYAAAIGSGYVSGAIDLSGGTSAAPTGAGATAKAALITAGVTVTTN